MSMEQSEHPNFSLEQLAFMLRKAGDDVWSQAGDFSAQKLIASQVHELAAKLLAIHVNLESHRRAGRFYAPSST